MSNMSLNYAYLIFFLISNFYVINTKENEKTEVEEDNKFIPTHEWQVIKKDQAIPKGLHIRINFQTGLKEAKLLDEDKSDENKNRNYEIATTPNLEVDDDAGDSNLIAEQLLSALKNIKDESPQIDKKEHKFRSYEELKKDLEDINLISKTDAEILQQLIEEHKNVVKENPDNEDHILNILEDLDYLVHQYDNANEFANLNGFRDIILINLNSTNANIKKEALKLLGSSMQNNAKIQIHALELGYVEVLLRILTSDSNANIKGRAIFALGTLLRRFPLAQSNFMKNTGLNVFINLLETSNDLKIFIKVLTLINDLIEEHQETLNNTNEYKVDKIKQYKQIRLKERLNEERWCHHLSPVLIKVSQINSYDHDVIEKCLNGINLILDTCDSDTANELKDVLRQLIVKYKLLTFAGEETNLEYYNEMLNLCLHINDFLNYKYKTEL